MGRVGAEIWKPAIHVHNYLQFFLFLTMSMLHYLTSQAGVLVFGERGAKGGTESVIDALMDNAIPHEVMSGAEANARYPDQLKLPDGYICAFEGSGGILRANKAVATFQVRTSFDFYSCLCFLRNSL